MTCSENWNIPNYNFRRTTDVLHPLYRFFAVANKPFPLCSQQSHIPPVTMFNSRKIRFRRRVFLFIQYQSCCIFLLLFLVRNLSMAWAGKDKKQEENPKTHFPVDAPIVQVNPVAPSSPFAPIYFEKPPTVEITHYPSLALPTTAHSTSRPKGSFPSIQPTTADQLPVATKVSTPLPTDSPELASKNSKYVPTIIINQPLPATQVFFQIQPGSTLDPAKTKEVFSVFMQELLADTSGKTTTHLELFYLQSTGAGQVVVTGSWVGPVQMKPSKTSIQRKFGFWGINDLERELEKSGIQTTSLLVQVEGETVQPAIQNIQSKDEKTAASTKEGSSTVLVSTLILTSVAFILIFAVYYLVIFRRNVANRQKTYATRPRDDTLEKDEHPVIVSSSSQQGPQSIMNGKYITSAMGPDLVSSLGDPSIHDSLIDPSVVGSLMTDENHSVALTKVRSNASSGYDPSRLDQIIDNARKEQALSLGNEKKRSKDPDGISVDYSLDDYFSD